jgi:hypothetical protein
MSSSIILFDLRSGNVMTDFACERDAWDELRAMAHDDGPEAVEGLSLLLMEDGLSTLIAMEDELVRRVVDETSQETVTTESRR